MLIRFLLAIVATSVSRYSFSRSAPGDRARYTDNLDACHLTRPTVQLYRRYLIPYRGLPSSVLLPKGAFAFYNTRFFVHTFRRSVAHPFPWPSLESPHVRAMLTNGFQLLDLTGIDLPLLQQRACIGFAVIFLGCALLEVFGIQLVDCGLTYLALSAMSAWMAATIKELMLRQSFEASAQKLEEEVQMFKEMAGIMGEGAENLLEELKAAHLRQKAANARQSMLVKSQAQIVLLQLMQHFDTNKDFALSEAELLNSKAYLAAGFPNANFDALVKRASEGNAMLTDLESILMPDLGA